MRLLDATRNRDSSLAAAHSLRVAFTVAQLSINAALNAPIIRLLATVLSFSTTSWVGAQTIFNWDPPPHANVFSTSTNWTPTGPPGSTGEARFNSSASAYTVSFSNDPTNARTRVGDDHVTFNLNGHTYTLT